MLPPLFPPPPPLSAHLPIIHSPPHPTTPTQAPALDRITSVSTNPSVSTRTLLTVTIGQLHDDYYAPLIIFIGNKEGFYLLKLILTQVGDISYMKKVLETKKIKITIPVQLCWDRASLCKNKSRILFINIGI